MEDESGASAAEDDVEDQEEPDQERTHRKEVEHFLQEKLEKLSPGQENNDGVEKPRGQKKSEDGVNTKGQKSKTTIEDGIEKAEVEEDLLTLLDEPWDIPKIKTGEAKLHLDNITLPEELELNEKALKKRESLFSQDKVKEEEKERDQLLLVKEKNKLLKSPTEEKEAHLTSDEKPKKEEETHRKQTIQSLGIGYIWEQKKQKIKKIMDRRKINLIPQGYFGMFSKRPAQSTVEPALKTGAISEQIAQKSEEPVEQQPTEEESRSKTKRKFSQGRKSLKKSPVEKASVSQLSKVNLFEEPNEAEDHKMDSDFISGPEISGDKMKKRHPKDSLCHICYSPGGPSSVWTMGQRASHWRVSQTHTIPEQEKQYKQKVAKHARDSKVAVPLPLRALMEEEVLAILTNTLGDYQKNLGKTHPLTIQIEEQVERLHLQLQGRGMI